MVPYKISNSVQIKYIWRVLTMFIFPKIMEAYFQKCKYFFAKLINMIISVHCNLNIYIYIYIYIYIGTDEKHRNTFVKKHNCRVNFYPYGPKLVFFASDIVATGNVNWLKDLFSAIDLKDVHTCLNLAVCNIGTSRKTQYILFL